MNAYVENDTDHDTLSNTIPDTEDVVQVDTSSDTPSNVPSDPILETQDEDDADTDSDKILDMEASTELDEPLPPASDLDLLHLHAKAIAEAQAYTRIAVPDNRPIATYLHLALIRFGSWACTSNKCLFERLGFLETHDDPRAHDIARLMHGELDKVSTAINELIDLEIEAAISAHGGDASARNESSIERDTMGCREYITDIIRELKNLRNTTDENWPVRRPDQHE